MAGIRMTGMVSGLDTETLVTQLSQAYQTKVDNVKKEQTKLEWKKEAWSALNTKIMDFYKGALSTFKSISTYRAKSATGDLTGVKVTAGSDAVNGTHTVQVLKTATAQMWTGKQLNKTTDVDGKAVDKTYTSTSYKAASDNSMKLSDLKDKNGYSVGDQIRNAEFTVSDNGTDYNVKVNVGDDATIQDVLDNINSQLNGSGVKVDFAAGNFRMSNESATSRDVQNDTGETVTIFENGHDVKVQAADETSANIFGIYTKEATLYSKSSKESDVTVVGGSTKFYEEVQNEGTKVTGSSKLMDLGIAEGTEIKINGNAITVDRTTTLSSLATQMAKLGIEANYDAGQGRFYLNSKGTGEGNAFTIEAVNADGSASDALSVLGLDLQEGDEGRIDAQDAEILYNGVQYKQSSSTFNINGLTIEATAEGSKQTFTVGTDAQGIYDKVKEFVKSYNDLIDEMNTMYNAKRVKDYEPLTDDEKKSMSDDEVEKWEAVIKGSLLRRDDTISSLLSSMRTTLSKQVAYTSSDGTTKNYALTSFGINTSVYTEHGKLHIYGNSEDSDFADYDDSLMKAIMADPEAVAKTFSELGNEIYKNLQTAMKRVDGVSSSLTFYNDQQIDKEIDSYKDRVSTLQEKMIAEQDKYYKQFSAMETALAKLQSQQTYISQLFGG
ncbi:MAG: flagellar filament capping protein FliD [Clostridium sp.]|nr:flagellar filament capping protein FliD [Clostridium sp.]